MATTFAGTVVVSLDGSYVQANDKNDVKSILNLDYEQAFANGSGDNQADCQWSDNRTLTAGSSEDIDLTTQIDDFNVAMGLSELKLLFIKNNSAVQTLTVFNASSNAFQGPVAASATVAIPPGGQLLLVNPVGWTVDGTHKVLKVANAAGVSADYDIIVWGN
jgi:hypothetical protein